MKNLLFTIALFTATTITSFAGTNPEKDVTIFESETVTLSTDAADLQFFKTATYENENFVFETKDEISFIQIFNEKGTLEFQLPVMSNKVTIGKSIMDSGNYKLGFMTDGSSQIHFTEVTVK